MESTRLLGVVLFVLGILGLVYGGFSYTKGTEKASLGPLQVVVQDKEHVNVPMWAGVAAIVVGGALLATGGKKS